MRERKVALLIAASASIAACATTAPVSDLRLCEQLDVFARTVPAGQAKTIRLVRGGTWMVDHYKSCTGPENDTAADHFCRWLIDNSSTEFMEVNINRALSCLQGQRIMGYLGNTGIESWTGKAEFFSPQIDSDVVVEVEYSVDYSTSGSEDFIQFKVVAQ